MKRSELIIKLIEHGFTQIVKNPDDPERRSVEYRKSMGDGEFLVVSLCRRRNRYVCGRCRPELDPRFASDYRWIRGAEHVQSEWDDESTVRQVVRFLTEEGAWTKS